MSLNFVTREDAGAGLPRKTRGECGLFGEHTDERSVCKLARILVADQIRILLEKASEVPCWLMYVDIYC
jgi:hypothetical protein